MDDFKKKKGFYGVAGCPVLHSKSPELFSLFSGEKGLYGRVSIANEAELRTILTHFPLTGLNVTSPLKEAALRLADECDETARIIGAANCLVNEKGRWKAFNTDYTAVRALIRQSAVPTGSPVLVAGAGGAGKAALAAALHEGMDVALTNRSRLRGKEAAVRMNVPLESMKSSWERYTLLISALPGEADPLAFHPEFHGKIIDAAYPRSKTTLRGLKRGLEAFRGEEWLMEQGRSSYALMTRSEPVEISWKQVADSAEKRLSPLVLTGFTGCGKTSAARQYEQGGLTVFSTDDELETRAGTSCHEAFLRLGEEGFRALEKAIVCQESLFSSDVIDSGGGLWLDPENRGRLPGDALVAYLWTTCETALLRASGRPLLQGKSKEEACRLYEKRMEHYFSLSGLIIPAELLTPEEIARRIGRERASVTRGVDKIDG